MRLIDLHGKTPKQIMPHIKTITKKRETIEDTGKGD